jgi:protein-L-isoaspartate(D-aspartate) O-methyltransferase
MTRNRRRSYCRFFSIPVSLFLLSAPVAGCAEEEQTVAAAFTQSEEDVFKTLRERMVRWQLEGRDVVSTPVLSMMRQVPRHKFVPPEIAGSAYGDHPLPIGKGQTISQPYIVGIMTQLLDPRPGGTVLEIGTGSGYQAAVLAGLVKEVFTIEIVEELGESAEKRLAQLGYGNVHVRIGDGYQGWPEHAPFDGVIVTAAPGHVPQPLKDQLKIGGRLVIPVGEEYQQLLVITRTEDGFEEKSVFPVRFVPMTGEAQRRKE